MLTITLNKVISYFNDISNINLRWFVDDRQIYPFQKFSWPARHISRSGQAYERDFAP